MSDPIPLRRIELFGIPIHNVTLEEAVERVSQLLQSGGKHFVTTPNVDHMMRLHKDKEFFEVYQKASLVVADGMPLVWASHLLGKPLKERVAGSDLFLPLCRLAAEKGHRIYFLGGGVGVAEKATQNLLNLFPSLRVVGHYAPPFGFESDLAENQRIIQLINQAKPDLLFVALGAPKQEKWIAGHIDELEFKVAFCIGASVDFVAGIVKRAPHWMQRAGLEWLWRLLLEPKRLWRRYLVQDMAFLPLVFNNWVQSWSRPSKKGGM